MTSQSLCANAAISVVPGGISSDVMLGTRTGPHRSTAVVTRDNAMRCEATAVCELPVRGVPEVGKDDTGNWSKLGTVAAQYQMFDERTNDSSG